MYGYRMHVQTDDLEIVMRPYELGEAAAAVEGLQSYGVSKYLFPLCSAQTLADEEAFVERIRTDQAQFLWAICVVCEGKEIPVGSTSIRINERRGLSGILIYDRTWWNRGIASVTHLARTMYAFDVLDLIAIDSKVISVNQASVRALEKVGYCRTGTDYHLKVVSGQVCHAIRLTVVNPSERSWNYFWGDSEVPPEFAQARLITDSALCRAREIVTMP